MRIFNISEENVKALYKQRISLDCLYILEKIYLEEEVLEGDVKCDSFLQTLERKGYINSFRKITDIGKELYEQVVSDKPSVKVPKIAIDKDGLSGIHKKLQDKILSLTGTKQVRPDIGGKKYSFLCNETDLITRLAKVITKYKLTDFEKIEKTLLNYIVECHRKNSWFPLLEYYILKEERSQMVTDMQNEDKPQRKQVEI